MTETWTTRMVVPQWGAGTDAPSRVDFDTAFLNLDTRAAYDDGVTYASVPTANLIPGRYARVSTTDGSYSLYRRSSTAWEYVGGPVSPIKLRSVALGSQVGTDQAFSLELTLGTPTLWGTYQGDLYANGVLRTNNMVGAAPLGDTLSPATTGRAYVKTQATGDLGLVVRAHASTAGNLVSVRDQGNNEVVSVDPTGRFRSGVASAFGGASMPSASTLAVAPSPNTSDAYINGLLLYGQSGAPTRSLMTAYAFNGDTAGPIATLLPNGATIGRMPWGTVGNGDGVLNLLGDIVAFRAGGANIPGAGQYSTWYTFRRASTSAPTDPTQDTNVFTLGLAGSTLGLPLYLSQENNGSTTNQTLYRFNDFTAGRFAELYQATRVNPTTVTLQLASDWNADGRLRTGTLWRGNGVVRDARLPVRHLCTKIWASPGDSPTAGQQVNPNNSFTYTFPVMQSRAFGGCDLDIYVILELMLGVGQSGGVDAQDYGIDCYVAINGGSFGLVAIQENAQTSAAVGFRPMGDVLHANFRVAAPVPNGSGTGIPNGGTFQVKLTFVVGAAVPVVFMRKLDLNVGEVTHEIYTAT